MENNKKSKLAELLDNQDNPFDNIEFGLDSEYVDIFAGYERGKGTFIKGVIDLNNIGKMSKEELELRKYELAVEAEKAKTERAKIVAQGGDWYPNIATPKKEEPKEKEENKTEKEESPIYNGMSAKAVLEDDEI